MKVDHDVDGIVGEDPADDLNGDGVITRLRIPDPAGGWLADPGDPRVLVKADAMEQRAGAYRIETEGKDDDGDGEFNEDAADGVWPDKNFPHAFPYSTPEAGPWSSYAPETRALMDFLLGRRNVALAVVYGPANNLLAAPQSLGGGGDLGTQKFKVPPQAAKFLGFDPEQEYTIDQIWEVAQNLPFVRQNGITKEQLQQFLGAGAATKVDAGDQAYLDKFAEGYKERLKKAGLSADRPGRAVRQGRLHPLALLPVRRDGPRARRLGHSQGREEGRGRQGSRRRAHPREGGRDEPRRVRRPGGGEDRRLPQREQGAAAVQRQDGDRRHEGRPAHPQGDDRPHEADGRRRRRPAAARRRRQAGEAGAREREVLAWVDANAPGAFTAWTPVTLPDGTKAEVGGLDPFVELNPPMAILKPALAAHTETVLDLAGKLAQGRDPLARRHRPRRRRLPRQGGGRQPRLSRHPHQAGGARPGPHARAPDARRPARASSW